MLPGDIVSRFRAQATADLEQIEIAWAALTEQWDPARCAQMQRRLHTIKGDSRIVGFTDINLVCQRLEDMVAAAQRQQFRVSDELDLVATMAMQFIGVLLKKRVGTGSHSLDLAGFVRQVDDVLDGRRPQGVPVPVEDEAGSGGVSSASTREQLADLAMRVWLEQWFADRAAQTRLRSVWQSLRALAAEEFVDLGSRIAHHAAAARALARQLGKQVRVQLDLAEVRVPSRIADTVNLVLVHLGNNAVDHGVGSTLERTRAGKDAVGSLGISAQVRGELLVVEVRDDGNGIDFDGVRARAIELGLCAESDEPSPEELTYLLFYPGFSSRPQVGAVSGRGVGLDSVKAALENVGGQIEVSSEAGVGTTFRFTLPLGSRSVAVRRFEGELPLCVPAEWQPRAVDDAAAVDPLRAFGFALRKGRAVELRREQERRLWMMPSTTAAVAEAQRICPHDDGLAEVVLIDGSEALLLRPDRLAG